MGTLTSQLILRLVDQLSGPASRVGGALSKTAADARRMGQDFRAQDSSVNQLKTTLNGAAGSLDRMGSAQRRLRLDTQAATAAFQKQLAATRAASTAAMNARGGAGGGGALVAGAAGIGARGLALAGGAYGVGRMVTSSITSYADLDRQMRRVGLTADATSTQVAAATGSVKSLAMEAALPVGDVVKGLEALVAQGRTLPDSMAILPSVARTAQAAGAEVEDIAKSADALASHLGIASKEMQAAFDTLVAGGKAGQFELKDMARYLPSIAPAAKAIGLEGQKGLTSLVAMFQIIRKGSGTSEEAAASMNNILQKMNSEETTKKFKKMGVDLEAAFAKGKKEGRNLIEVFEEAAWKAIKGDLSQLPKLISDMEFARGVRAILSMRGAWQEMAKTIEGTAAGSTMRDFNAVAADSAAKIQRMSNAWANFKTSLGATLAPAIIPVLEQIQQKIDALNKAPDRSSPGDRLAAGRKAYMEEAGAANPLVDKDGKYIGPRSSSVGGANGLIAKLLNPETYGYGKSGSRDGDLASARWRGVQAAIAERVAGENATLAAPARVEEMIRRQEGLAGASAGRAGMPGMAGVTAREQVAKARAEIARLQGELANARAKASEVAARRAAAPGEIADLRSRQLSGSFGIGGPSGSAPGTVGSGILNFGPQGAVRPRVDPAEAESSKNIFEELLEMMKQVGATSTRPRVDSSEIDAAQAKADRLSSTLQRLGSEAASIGRRAEQSVRAAIRAGYNDYNEVG